MEAHYLRHFVTTAAVVLGFVSDDEKDKNVSMTVQPNRWEVNINPEPKRERGGLYFIPGSVPSGGESASASAGQTHGRLEEQTMWSRQQDKLLHMKHRTGFGFSPKNDGTEEGEAQCYTPPEAESQQNDSLQHFKVTGHFFSISSKPLPTLKASCLFCCSAFTLISSNWRRAAACQYRNILLALQLSFLLPNHFEILCKPRVGVKERQASCVCIKWDVVRLVWKMGARGAALSQRHCVIKDLLTGLQLTS